MGFMAPMLRPPRDRYIGRSPYWAPYPRRRRAAGPARPTLRRCPALVRSAHDAHPIDVAELTRPARPIVPRYRVAPALPVIVPSRHCGAGCAPEARTGLPVPPLQGACRVSPQSPADHPPPGTAAREAFVPDDAHAPRYRAGDSPQAAAAARTRPLKRRRRRRAAPVAPGAPGADGEAVTPARS